MWIFKTLMTSRVYGWTLDSVHALNIIDIVFCDDNSVRIAWKELYDKYSVSNPDKQHLLKVEQAQYRLLEEIAIVLGYKDKITWETIQNPYIPQRLVDHIKAQQLNQQMYADVLQSAKNMIPSNAGETENNAN